MNRLHRWLWATAVVTGAVAATARAQEIDPRTGLPNQQGAAFSTNAGPTPYNVPGQYGASLRPAAPDQPPADAALGTGAEYPRFLPRGSITYLAGNGIGYRSSFATLEGWVPFQVGDENQLVFVDMRGILNNDARVGSNLGVGFRRYNAELERVFGAYLYYDYRDSGLVRYDQISFGLETLGRYFDARTNVYLPFSDNVSLLSDSFDTANPLAVQNFLFLTHTRVRETAMKGFDGEVGVPLIERLRLRGFLGGYYFTGHATPEAYGFRARVEMQATNGINLQLAFQTDRVFGSSVIGGATVSWPGVGRREVADDQPDMLNRLNDPVQRLYNIVLNRPVEVTREAAVSPTTNQPIRIVYVDASAAPGGNGTIEHPFQSLPQAQNGSIGGDIILVRAGTYTSGIVLQSDQRLLGDGIALPNPNDPLRLGGYIVQAVQAPNGLILPNVSRDPANRPNLVNIAGNAITLNDRNEVSNFNIRNPSASGIFGDGFNSANIHELVITQAGNAGIRLNNAAGSVSIRKVSLLQENTSQSATGADGGLVMTVDNGAASTVELLAINSQNNFGDGIALRANSGSINATLNNGVFTGNAGQGLTAISTGGAITVNGTLDVFDQNALGGAALDALKGSVTASLSRSTFNNNTTNGAQIPSSGLTILAGAPATTAGAAATSGTASVTLLGDSFNNNEGRGLDARSDGAASAMTITAGGSTFIGNPLNGVSITSRGGSTTAVFTNDQILNSGHEGFVYLGLNNSTAKITIDGSTVTGNGNARTSRVDERDGVLMTLFGTGSPNLTATISNDVISNNGNRGFGGGLEFRLGNFNTTNATANLTITNNQINSNQGDGLRAFTGSGGLLTLTATISGNTFNANGINGINGIPTVTNGLDGLNGLDIINRGQGRVTYLIDNNTITNNAANGIFFDNEELTATDDAEMSARVRGNIIENNGFNRTGTAGVLIFNQGTANNFNIDNNIRIDHNNRGVDVANFRGISGIGPTTSTIFITNHRNLFDNTARIFANSEAGIVIDQGLTGPVAPPAVIANSTLVNITNNSISSAHEAIALDVFGGNGAIPLAGQRMDAVVTQNFLIGPGFAPLVSVNQFGLVNFPEVQNARFIASSTGVRSFMRLRLENNINDLQYNLVKLPPIPGPALNATNGNLFEIAASADTNRGRDNPLLGPGVFGVNAGVYGFVPPADSGFDFQQGPTLGANQLINIVAPASINPPFAAVP